MTNEDGKVITVPMELTSDQAWDLCAARQEADVLGRALVRGR
jgi:hypothetical protein